MLVPNLELLELITSLLVYAKSTVDNRKNYALQQFESPTILIIDHSDLGTCSKIAEIKEGPLFASSRLPTIYDSQKFSGHSFEFEFERSVILNVLKRAACYTKDKIIDLRTRSSLLE